MSREPNRRRFLQTSAAVAAGQGLALSGSRPASASATVAADLRVVVWDERQPAQKQAYENFLGNQIADHLRAQPGLQVRSVALDDPGQGLGDDVLDACDVLVWWGHVRQAEVTPETGRKIVARILSGRLALVALHSAHWSTPFVEAMHERARRDLDRAIRGSGDIPNVEVVERPPANRYTVPKRDARLTPSADLRKFPDGRVQATLHLPTCCFPAYRGDGKPSTVRVRTPEHPVMRGVPPRFTIARTEMYDEPFHVPEPDEVLFEESWADGSWFRSGMVWRLGKGRVLYFRPGHETFPVFKEPVPLQVLTNAVRWLGSNPA